jgi:hypothetical protein
MSEKKLLEIVKGRAVEFEDKKLTSPRFRISYPNLVKPKINKMNPDGVAKYSIAMIFSKDSDLSQLKIAAHNACVAQWGPDKAAWPSKKVRNSKGEIVKKSLVELPFKDGDILMPDKEEYENSIFFNASRASIHAKTGQPQRPATFNQAVKAIDPSTIKAGDYCCASLIANAFEVEGSYKVSFTLMAVQLLEEGEALGGSNSANDFEAHDVPTTEMSGDEGIEEESEEFDI